MKSYHHIKQLDVPLYKLKFVVVISNDLEECKKMFPVLSDYEFLFAHSIKSSLDTDNDGVKYRCASVIFNFHNPVNVPITIGTVCHEVSHLVGYVAEHAGLETEPAHTEHLAYLAGWFGDRISEFMREKKFVLR